MKNIIECNYSINKFIEHAIVKCPVDKITNINNNVSKRDETFCVFIMTFGRADNIKTYKTLMEYEGTSFNQDFYLICSDDDKKLQDYIDKFGDRVLIFNKKKVLGKKVLFLQIN